MIGAGNSNNFQLMSIYVGFMLFDGKRYSEEINPSKEVWGYEDIAEAAFGIIGKVCLKIYYVAFYWYLY